jgi:deferrochelatase/peroxidase EfeB
MAGQEVDWNEVQGIVLSSYWDKPYTRYLLLRIEEPGAARRWLRSMLQKGWLSVGDDRTKRGPSINVAFTFSGLEKLELPDAALNTFPWDFRDGMTSPLRTRILADRGANDPWRWQWGRPGTDTNPDLLVMLYATSERMCNRWAAVVVRRFGNAFSEIPHPGATIGYRPADGCEHFGFADGLSQPAIETSPRSRKFAERGETDAIIRAGEFILGYVNERGQLPVSPSVARVPGSRLPVITKADHTTSGYKPGTVFPRLDFGRNGSFLVYRQLEQDVFAFDDLIRESVAALGENGPRLADEAPARQWLAAKLVGRWPDGTPLTLEPKKPPTGVHLKTVNDFGYAAEDAHGVRCPLGAHIRRGNPRDTLFDDPEHALSRNNKHRLLRRGRLYGPKTDWKIWDDKPRTGQREKRGLHFVALNASLESQFEFVQQSWMHTPFFGGLTDEFDPLLGMPVGDNDPRYFTVQGSPINRRIRWTPPLVTVRGGAYFFLPSKAAIELLADAELMNAIRADRVPA